jgi:hypothetical protein
MRLPKYIPGALTGLLLAAAPAASQETVLSGILGPLLPEARVSWSVGTARGGAETYEDLFVGQGDARLRAGLVTVTPEGPVAKVEAEGLVLNLDTDETFSMEIGSLTTTLSAPMIAALRGVSGVPDLCRITAAGTLIEITDLRVLRDVGRDGLRRIRSETRIDRISIRQDVAAAGVGCEVRISVGLRNASEVRSDKSGTRIDRFDLSLSLPGNVETLASGSAPDLSISATFAGLLRQVPGGASIALVRDGAAQAELAALSAVPALTAFLRSRDDAPVDRAAAVSRALIPGDLRLSGALTGSTLLAEALVPADRISGLSRASLSSLIGDYSAEFGTRGGQAAVLIGSEIVGVGRSALEARARISERGPDAPQLDLIPSIEPFLPRFHLETATLRHEDRGLLRAIELITGSPVSVLAAIYLKEGLPDLPDPWQAPVRRAVSEVSRFLSLTTTGVGAEIELSTPTDLSVLETYRLLSLRPELADQLIASEVRRTTPQ